MAKLNLWDTHAHLDDVQFDRDRNELIPQLGQTLAGVINPAVDLESCEKIMQLTEQYPFIYAAVGWHPENLRAIPTDFEDKIAHWTQHPKVVPLVKSVWTIIGWKTTPRRCRKKSCSNNWTCANN